MEAHYSLVVQLPASVDHPLGVLPEASDGDFLPNEGVPRRFFP